MQVLQKRDLESFMVKRRIACYIKGMGLKGAELIFAKEVLMRFQTISHQQAEAMLSDNQTLILDVRDRATFDAGHIPHAEHVTVDALDELCAKTAHDRVILIYCHHGITSQSVAQHLVDYGFTNVYSLVGGFEIWRENYPAADEG